MTETKDDSKTAAKRAPSDDTKSTADQKVPPDVIEAALIYAGARHNLYLADKLTRSA